LDDFAYAWQVTVPAGGTVILMHFAVQREPYDRADAQAQAESLRDLIDPEALVGMTAEEAAAVVNFSVPVLEASSRTRSAIYGRVDLGGGLAPDRP
jgi:hypothetical protein